MQRVKTKSTACCEQRLFIDVHTVLKRALRASVEEYSLKALEVFHGFCRAVPLEEARSAMRQMQHALELGQPTEVMNLSGTRSLSTTLTIVFRLDPCATGLSANGRPWC